MIPMHVDKSMPWLQPANVIEPAVAPRKPRGRTHRIPDGELAHVAEVASANPTAPTASVVDGTYVESDRVTVKDCLEKEWLPAVRATVAPNAHALYTDLVRACVVPHIGSVRLQKVTASILNTSYVRARARGATGGSAPRGRPCSVAGDPLVERAR